MTFVWLMLTIAVALVFVDVAVRKLLGIKRAKLTDPKREENRCARKDYLCHFSLYYVPGRYRNRCTSNRASLCYLFYRSVLPPGNHSISLY